MLTCELRGGEPISTVRPIDVASDLPALRRLWRATWRETYGPMLGRGRLHLVDEALAGPALLRMVPVDGGALAAVEGSDVVGSACFAERHGVGYVWGLYVHGDHRRRGHGSALMREAARAMAGAATLQVTTVTPAAEAFYRRLGFAAVGTSAFELFRGVVVPSAQLGIDPAALRGAGTGIMLRA